LEDSIMVARTPDPRDVDRAETVVTHEESAAPLVEREVVAATDPVVVVAPAEPASGYSERVAVDYAAERQATLNRVSQAIGFVFGLIEAFIGIRVILRLIGANPDNAFAQFIYNVSAPFVAPFVGLTGTPAFGTAALEVSSLIAMLVYALIWWALVKLVWMIFYRPATRDVSSRAYHRD
jgi:hypothetical protein